MDIFIIIFAFIGMYASGVLSCVVVILALDIFKQKPRKDKNRGGIYGRAQHRP